ncbi:hypothetical protein J6590_038513 [Homalodisca vitripennis]|nr:hypothetical protein J6590_038513 [Homalodisca vitripennis]
MCVDYTVRVVVAIRIKTDRQNRDDDSRLIGGQEWKSGHLDVDVSTASGCFIDGPNLVECSSSLFPELSPKPPPLTTHQSQLLCTVHRRPVPVPVQSVSPRPFPRICDATSFFFFVEAIGK